MKALTLKVSMNKVYSTFNKNTQTALYQDFEHTNDNSLMKYSEVVIG